MCNLSLIPQNVSFSDSQRMGIFLRTPPPPPPAFFLATLHASKSMAVSIKHKLNYPCIDHRWNKCMPNPFTIVQSHVLHACIKVSCVITNMYSQLQTKNFLD